MAISGVGQIHLVPQTSGVEQATPGQRPEVSFAKVVEHLLGDANSQQVHADQLVQQLAVGKTDNLHDVMLAVVKADLSLRTVLEVRNRLTEAYQEIMRMQV